MRGYIVRLSSLTLANIKNVKSGQIIMPKSFRRLLDSNGAEILGIYGQNGSGKTAVVDALYYLQKIMIGEMLEDEIAEYIDAGEAEAEIVADFNVFLKDCICEVTYKIILKKNDIGVVLQRETISCAKNIDGKRSNKTVFMDYKRDDKDIVFAPKVRFDELVAVDKENKTDLIVARKMAEKSNCSYIFGENSREIFVRNYDNNFKNYAEIIYSLFMFALKDLFVIRNTHSGVISANFVLPMAFKIEQDEMGMKGDFAVSLTEPVVLEKERKQLLEILVEQINTVLYTIILG